MKQELETILKDLKTIQKIIDSNQNNVTKLACLISGQSENISSDIDTVEELIDDVDLYDLD